MLAFRQAIGFLLPLARLTTAVTKHGTIGYGINMYHPWCCYACLDSLATVYINCTTFSKPSGDDGMSMKLRKRMDMDMEMTGTTSDECYASNKPYLQSMAYCIQSHCDAEGLSYEKQNSCFQGIAAGGVTVPTLHDALPGTPPTEELAADAMWLNKTMLVNEDYWKADRGTIEEFEISEEDHVKFSIIVMTFCVCIPLLAGAWLFLNARFPTNLRKNGMLASIQSHFVLPALFGKRHSEPLPYNIGYVPNRAMSTLISLYVILNVIFCAVPYKSVQPNTWYTNKNQEMAAYVANRAGVLSFANMALAILFSSRNNPLMFLSGWGQTTFLAFHRWAARVAILQAVVHSIVYTADYCDYFDGGNAYYAEAAKPYFWWGIIATTAMGLMAGLSTLPLRKYAYELFLVLHIVLAILSLMGSWYHVDIRYSKKWGYEVWLYIAFAFWSWDRFVRLLKLAYYSLPSRTPARVQLVPGTNIIMLTLFPGKGWTLQPGQHTFVYFPSSTKFWENHPFTILDGGYSSNNQIGADDGSTTDNSSTQKEAKETQVQQTTKAALSNISETATGNLEQRKFYVRCLFRVHEGMTAQLYRTVAGGMTLQTSILTEGPYGGHSPTTKQILRRAEKILCIAGGIGITHAAGFAKQLALERSRSTSDQTSANTTNGALLPRCRQFVLAWTVRESGLLEYVQKKILPSLEVGGLDDGSMRYRFWLTGDPAAHTPDSDSATSPDKIVEAACPDPLIDLRTGHRMDVAELIASESGIDASLRTLVLVCGPGGLADEVRRQVARRTRDGATLDLIEEDFKW